MCGSLCSERTRTCCLAWLHLGHLGHMCLQHAWPTDGVGNRRYAISDFLCAPFARPLIACSTEVWLLISRISFFAKRQGHRLLFLEGVSGRFVATSDFVVGRVYYLYLPCLPP